MTRHRRAGILLVPLLVAYLASGCSEDGGGAGDRAEPETPSTEPLILDTAIVIPATSILHSPLDLEVDSQGRIWVLNASAPYFVALSETGEEVLVWGERGGGPQEFRRPAAFVETGRPPEQVWAYDFVRNGAFLVSSGREGWREVVLGIERRTGATVSGFGDASVWPFSGDPFEIYAFGSSLVLPYFGPEGERRLGDGEGFWRATLHSYDPDSDSARPVFSIMDEVPPMEEVHLAATRLVSVPLWDLCGDGSIALYDPAANHVRWYARGEGSATFEQAGDSVPLGPLLERPLTVDVIFDLFLGTDDFEDSGEARRNPQAAREMVEQIFAEERQLFAVNLPEYTELLCDDVGRAWVQRYATGGALDGRGREWVLVVPGGVLRPVTFPQGFRPFRIYGERAWGIATDELGVPQVAYVEVPAG